MFGKSTAGERGWGNNRGSHKGEIELDRQPAILKNGSGCRKHEAKMQRDQRKVNGDLFARKPGKKMRNPPDGE